MLVSIRLGKDKVSNTWGIIKDDHDNIFVANDLIKQRIRINKQLSVPDTLEEIKSMDNRINQYVMPEGGHWVNNNKNMNPLWIRNNKKEDIDGEQIVVYLTVSKDLKMTKYKSKVEILQTFHMKDVYQGCAMVFTQKELIENPVIMEIKAFDTVTKKYISMRIEYFEGNFRVFSEVINSKKVIEDMAQTIKKHPTTSLSFKILIKSEKFLTKVFLINNETINYDEKNEMFISSDEKINNTLNLIKSRVSDSVIISADQDDLMNPQITEYIKNEKIRSITMIGIEDSDLLAQLIKEMRLLYVFSYDLNTGKTVSKKNN